MWARGDHHEAVRWLRRAAEAASDAGQDLRAVALAKTAADLTAALQLPPSIPPPAAAPAPPPVAAAVAPPPSRPHPPKPRDDTQTEITAKIPPHSRPDRAVFDEGEMIHDRTIPDVIEAQRSPPPPPSRSRNAPPMRSSPSAAPPPPSRSSPSASPPPPMRSSPSAAPPPMRSSPSAAPPAMAVRPRQALRVSVTPSPDDKTLLLVRPLLDDEAAPAGTHEAILTALEPGAHLLSKKR
jgi:hypothetical protein